MKQFRKIATYVALALLPVLANSCTDLSENLYDQIATDEFYNNKNEVISAVLRPYTHANAWITPSGQNGWWRLSELSADQLAWPQKGRHGYDGGNWIRLHYHTWTVDDGPIRDCWRLVWVGTGFCTTAIENLEKRDASAMGLTQTEKDGYTSELRLLRAFHYLRIMDLWGNVPIITKVGEPTSPATATRKEVFEFVEKEIKDNIDKAPHLSKALLGRMSKEGAYAMLVELYLNAEKWSGTARWDDCIAAADNLIHGGAGGVNGGLALDTNLIDTYAPDNSNIAKENIFSIAYDFQISDFTPSWTGDFYHFVQGKINGNDRNGNDGVVVIPGVYTTFDAADKRKKEWILEGPQWEYDSADTIPVITTGNEYDGEQLVFVDNIQRNKANSTVSNMTEGEENSGVRFNKYKLGSMKDPHYRSTDWAVYRLSWVYYAKAEALMRKNGGVATQEAVDLINVVRQRAFDKKVWDAHKYTTTTLTMDELLAEIGREFIFEGYRRQVLIRWDKFTTATWWDHKATEGFRTLFAIPQNQRANNVNLAQNPGYPN
ncbi:RagB/SusD family nutrient uptake outer membrane protein [Chitinophaga sp. CF418]|uniref:RagB/SusD family nutrient uptake outer membrane protein n=1 Tax=Chitinophaga sp. CF418 TaxID=1855287 RepID=UPI0009241EE9|nr:RagB/SusD family nutrient uptake outer membrane protein [Chitinophaga sp. CF418]SHM16421.1 Starch-binding associating with outer membrane [Chitinophaga sp. CF418]